MGEVVQQVLWEVGDSYLGHPYFVTGHALFNAIGRRVDAESRRGLHVSTGVFVPGEYGRYPSWHSHAGEGWRLSGSLPVVESYEDLFMLRDVAHRWLLDSRPRDAHNTHDLQRYADRVAFANRCYFGRPADVRQSKRSVKWFVQAYLHATGEGVVPVSENVLDGIRVGGARNYGFGELSLVDTQVVGLDALDYSRVTGDDGEGVESELMLELVSPYVLSSEHPGADSQSVPWWWETGNEAGGVSGLRRRETRLVDGDRLFAVSAIDHGQIVQYSGDEPVKTAKNGVVRVGSHSKYGFGEFRLRPADESRVFEGALEGGVT